MRSHTHTRSLITFESLRLCRPVKQAFVHFHVTSDDIDIRSRTKPLSVPERTTSQRNTWPTSLKDKRPGTYHFDNTPTLVKTPWEYERARRPASQWSRAYARKPPSPFIFGQLPREILDCVLDHLKLAHLSDSAIDGTSLQNDLRLLLFTNKHWHRVAREHLYREIWLPRNEDPKKTRFSFRRPLSRLKLLLRTLKDASGLAYMVRHLRVTGALAIDLDAAIYTNEQARKGNIIEVLEDILSKCPNLERLTGYAPFATGRTAGLFAALSSCGRLKSHAWNLPTGTDAGFSIGDFINCHSQWQHLETLVLWTESHGNGLGPGVVSAIVQRLQCLKHLEVGQHSSADFHNGTLLMLPALKSLRLDTLDGVTDQGIQQLALSRCALSLESLTLNGLELTSLRTVQTIFANMSRLRRFTLVQDTSPELQQGISPFLSDSFSLSSPSLQYLHWDATIPGNSVAIFANSIAAGGFPNLVKVTVPCDYDGAIQRLCRPIPQQPLAAIEFAELRKRESGQTYPRSLRASQAQAELRIRESRKEPSINVVVQDEDEEIQETHVIGSYIGSLSSKIEYSLEPAVRGGDSALASIEDVWRMRPGAQGGDKDRGQLLDARAIF